MANKKNDQKSIRYELRNVDDLIPYARNARTHSPEQITKLASSIKEFGFISPVIISEDGGILAGHGRVMAAKKLGIEKVPCIIESHLTQAQKRAYILADNRLALDAGWDDEMLKIEIQELSQSEFDLQSIGFSEYELGRFLKENALARKDGRKGGFNCPIVYDEIVCPTIVSSGSIYRFDRKEYFSEQDIINVSSFPQDYDFCGNSVKYVCGMSVPPNMMANIAQKIWEQWLMNGSRHD